MKKYLVLTFAFIFALTLAAQPAFARKKKRTTRHHARRHITYALPSGPSVLDGRYLMLITECNECHTAGWTDSGGTVDQQQWLTGSAVGYRGPWGTTYPANLRTLVQGMSEDDWVGYAHGIQTKPPMPWYTLRVMKDRELRAMYRFIKALGPQGGAVPEFVPPDKEPKTPYILYPETKK